MNALAAREVSCEIWHPQQRGERLSKTKYRLTTPYNHQRELIMDILRWGEEAEVAEPPDLRETVKTTIEKMREKYKLIHRKNVSISHLPLLKVLATLLNPKTFYRSLSMSIDS